MPRRPHNIFQAYETLVDRFARQVATQIGNKVESFLYDQARRGLSYFPGDGDVRRQAGQGLEGDGPTINRGRYRRIREQGAECPNCHVPIYQMDGGIYLCARCQGHFRVLHQRTSFGPEQDSSGTRTSGRREPERPFSGKKTRAKRPGTSTAAGGKRKGRGKAQTSAPPPRAPEPPTFEQLVQEAHKVLGLSMANRVTVEDVRQRRRELATKYHPDRGGDAEKLKTVNAAADLVIEYLEKKPQTP